MTRIQRSCDLSHATTTDRIIAALYDVHGELGHGFSEAVFRRALALVLRQGGLAVAEEAALQVLFRAHLIGSFRADLIVERAVLVEVKAAGQIDSYAEAQILNYLKAAGGGVGLLVNFGRSATFKRFVVGDPANSLPHLRLPEQEPPQ